MSGRLVWICIMALVLVVGILAGTLLAIAADPLPVLDERSYLPLVSRALPSPTPIPAPTATPPPTATPQPPPAAVCACHADLYNCPDFATQYAAQACYDHCVGLGAGDVHKLDSDHDGIACETLP